MVTSITSNASLISSVFVQSRPLKEPPMLPKPPSRLLIAMMFVLLPFCSFVEAANILVGDDTSMTIPIADKTAEEKAVILNRRAWYFLEGDNTTRRLRLLDSNADHLILGLHATLKPGSYELFVQAPGQKKLAINHNVQVHSPQILDVSVDTLEPGGRINLSGNYFGQHPRLFLDYQIGENTKLQSLRVNADEKSFKYDDQWDKFATLYPTDTATGESYLEVVIPKLPKNSRLVAIRVISNTGEETQFSRSYENRSMTAKAAGETHRRGEIIGWSIRDADVRSKNAWDFMLNGLTDQGGWWSKLQANGLLLTTKLWRDMKYDLRLYSVSYYTEDAKGRIVPTAGVVIIPVTPAGTKVPLISFQHGTMLEEKQAPTVSNGPELGMAVAMASSSGFMMSVPDHLGLGFEALKHPDQYHPYCQWAPLGRDNGDMLVAVQSLLKDPTFQGAVKDLPAPNGQLFLTGYSEGGYLTLGLHRELEAHPEQYGNLKVTGSAPLSGPYAISTTMLQKLMERQPFASPYFAPYLLVTLNQTYGIFASPDQYLASPYDQTIPRLIDGKHPDVEVNKAMPQFIEDMLIPSVRSDLKSARGELFRTLQANDLTGGDGSGYSLEAPVHLVHGAVDDLVPRGNTEKAMQYFKGTLLKNNVDSEYLESNAIMWAAHQAGQPYHVLYAPVAMGASLEWLNSKINETNTLASPP